MATTRLWRGQHADVRRGGACHDASIELLLEEVALVEEEDHLQGPQNGKAYVGVAVFRRGSGDAHRRVNKPLRVDNLAKQINVLDLQGHSKWKAMLYCDGSD